MTGVPNGGFDVQVFLNGTLLPASSIALPLSITHGRSGITQQPDAPTARWEWLEPTPPGVVGDLVQIGRPSSDQAYWVDDRVTWVDGEYTWTGVRDLVPKFTGSIVAMKATEANGVVTGWEVECVGRQAALGRIPIIMVRPVETDVERVLAIASEVGYILNVIGTSDLLLAADTIDTNALAALHQVAFSTAGILWQGRSGDLWYGTNNHRELPVRESLEAAFLADGVEWDNDNDNIVNSITVAWGRESASEQVDAVWNYDPSTVVADPGNGDIRFNLAPTLAGVSPFVEGATLLAVSRWEQGGVDMAPVLRQLPVGANVYMQQKDDSDKFGRYSVDGAVTDNGTWFLVPIRWVENSGGGVSPQTHLLTRFGSTSKQSQTYTDQTSIAQWGLRHVNADTLLYDETQAAQLALLALGRRGQPYWRMPGVMVDYLATTASQAGAIDSLEVGDGVVIPVGLTPGPTPAEPQEWSVEGWVEEWGTEGHLMQLSLSDRARSGSTGLRDWGEAATQTWDYWRTGDRKWINFLVKGVGEP